MIAFVVGWDALCLLAGVFVFYLLLWVDMVCWFLFLCVFVFDYMIVWGVLLLLCLLSVA